MKKSLFMLAALAMLVASPSITNAQSLKERLKEAAKGAISTAVSNAVESVTGTTATTSTESTSSSSANTKENASSVLSNVLGSVASTAGSTVGYKNVGPKLYVNAETGSARNPGTKDAPFKDIQKAVDQASEGSVILVAEGNYLGTMNQGFIEVKKYVTIQGGYSSDFSEWDPIKHKTMIQTGPDQAGTSGNHGMMDVYIRGNADGIVIVDGICFDMGFQNKYYAPLPEHPETSTPEGCETGRLVLVGESPKFPTVGGAPINHQEIHFEVEGHFVIRNCTFINAYHYAIQGGCVSGDVNIYNNVFVNTRMAACEVRGMAADQDKCKLNFHDNTVMFTWCRDKELGDMGQGFRFMTGIHSRCYNNVFGCNILGGIERSYYDSNKEREAARETSAMNNSFFMNKADLILPSGGGKWLFVSADHFDEAECLKEYEGNKAIPVDDAFANAIEAAWLKGFESLEVVSSSSYNANSTANQVNRALGLNQQGSETIRVNMYANRYPWEKAFNFYGAYSGRGAQKPVKE